MSTLPAPVLLAIAQNPLGGGPSGRIGGGGERFGSFWKLIQQNPAETLLFGGALLLFLWLIHRTAN